MTTTSAPLGTIEARLAYEQADGRYEQARAAIAIAAREAAHADCMSAIDAWNAAEACANQSFRAMCENARPCCVEPMYDEDN